ncbi:MAG TPA: hypothetical protein ENK18_07395, partial [Deltaproteobacteria bacterium]|nr:hypothetical protein [Deltaproteobacteria bacterium]
MNIADPHELTAELAALASGLCLDAGLSLEVRGERWSYDPLRRTLCVAERSLREQGRDWCAGRLVNEIGHYWLTRHDLFPVWMASGAHLVPFPSEPIGRLVVDALDDARVNGWMVSRYPGSRPWLDRVHASLDRPLTSPMPHILRFCLECGLEPGRGWASTPHPIPGQVATALEQTRGARQRYAEQQPPVQMGQAPPDVRRRWEMRVRPAMNRVVWLPSPYEAELQLQALEALEIAAEEILPVAAELMADDLDQIERWLHQQPGEQGRLQQEIEEGRAQQAFQRACCAGPPSGAHPPSSRIRGLAQQLLEALGQQGAAQRQQRLCGGAPVPGRPGGVGPSPWRDNPLELPPAPPTDYGRARLQVASQIDQLVRLLGRVLKPRQRLRTRSGYPSGRRVDLKRLMKFDADPRLYN